MSRTLDSIHVNVKGFSLIDDAYAKSQLPTAVLMEEGCMLLVTAVITKVSIHWSSTVCVDLEVSYFL